MFDIGRVCVKIAGRDAGKQCVIIQKLDGGMVVIDGQTRRRKCNVRHLEPTDATVELKENAPAAEVKKAFSKLNIEVRETKPKQAGEKPRKQKAKKILAEEKQAKKEPSKKPRAPKAETPLADADEVAKELAGGKASRPTEKEQEPSAGPAEKKQ
ncbi:50S ribosomal protein L14e [Candidatus Woesearchaeota archaeon]|nr:50S ribosomal protein L14e [Candidatus Woesearchaeota archaeon]